MLNLSGHEARDLRKFARFKLVESIPWFRDEHFMRADIVSSFPRLGRLLLGCVVVSSLGCAMFEEDTQPKYTRNSPSSVTRHAPKPSGEKDPDPISFLGRERPK